MLGRAKPTSSAARASRKSARPACRRQERVSRRRPASTSRFVYRTAYFVGRFWSRRYARTSSGSSEQAEQEQRGGEASYSMGRSRADRVDLQLDADAGGRVIAGADGDDDASPPARREVARTEPSAESGGWSAWSGTRPRCENASSRSPARQRVRDALRSGRPSSRTFLTRRIVASTGGGATPSAAASARAPCGRGPAAAAGDAAEQGPEAVSSVRVVRATKTAARPVVTPGPTGPPSMPRKR